MLKLENCEYLQYINQRGYIYKFACGFTVLSISYGRIFTKFLERDKKRLTLRCDLQPAMRKH